MKKNIFFDLVEMKNSKIIDYPRKSPKVFSSVLKEVLLKKSKFPLNCKMIIKIESLGAITLAPKPSDYSYLQSSEQFVIILLYLILSLKRLRGFLWD